MAILPILQLMSQGIFPSGDNILGWIFQVVFLGIFVVFMFYGQRFQMMIMVREVESSLFKLKFMRDEARKAAINNIKEIGKLEGDPTPQIDRFLEYFAISPVELDPSGVIWR